MTPLSRPLWMGIGDEAGTALDRQLAAACELGWSHIELRAVEVPGFPKANVHDLEDGAFDQVARALDTSRIHAWCFGSTIMNWSRRVSDPFEVTLAEVQRTIPRMQQLGTRFVRIMSFKPGDEEHRIPAEVFRRVKDVTARFLDAGLQPVHENCMNYGGMSWQHALELLDKVPGLKWAFDTGNPIFNPDRSKARPWPRQDPWEFWVNVRDHVAHIHVKDACWSETTSKAEYRWPGEGEARVREILKDALARGYHGAISIEPHMVVVFHDAEDRRRDEDATLRNFVDYGRRLADLVQEIVT